MEVVAFNLAIERQLFFLALRVYLKLESSLLKFRVDYKSDWLSESNSLRLAALVEVFCLLFCLI